ncbi:hypothetical protein [Phycicoccus sp. Root101]|uniref:hypothetical protein n=1 Tax=Phycicoccus sp. Root101 TaxID=1736421 RepID=UPI000B3096F1|nr:hypothetical protein [Phycicoccus sp. Root101]
MTTMRKVGAYGPAVVVSMLLAFVVGAVLPATVGLAVFVCGLATMLVLLVGAGESAAVRVLFRARELSSAEAAALAPAVALLCQHGVPMGTLRLQVRDGAVPITAVGAGRSTVVVSAGLVAAVRDRQLPLDQEAAVLGHGAGVVLSGAVRSDLALEFWTLPWQALRGLADGLLLAFRWLPPVRWAWTGRFIVAAIAAAQAGAVQKWLVAAIITLVGALSYLVSPWERAWATTIRELGDEQVRQAGLAEALSRFLLRCSSSPEVHERVHALTGPAQRPQLAVVAPRA